MVGEVQKRRQCAERLLLKIKSEIPSCLCCLNSFTCHAKKIHSAAGLEPMLRLLAHEAQNPREGSGTIIGHLTGIIFIQAVRNWIESQPHGQGGWLGALRDKQVSSALNLMHLKPNAPWTIEKLASEVGMSRSPFAT